MTWSIKSGDLEPAFRVQLVVDGAPVDLSGKTVRFLMRHDQTDAPAVAENATITDAANGWVEYQWANGDTDIVGLYKAEFEVTASGRPRSFPQDGYLYIRIRSDLG